MTVEKEEREEEMKDLDTWGLLLPVLRQYLRPELPLVLVATLAGAVAASSAFGMPLIIKHVFPVVFGTQDMPPVVKEWMLRWVKPEDMEAAKLWVAVALIPLVMSVRGVCTYLNSYLLPKGGQRILRKMWSEMFTRLQSLSFSFFDRHKRGELLTIVIQFTQNLQGQMVTVFNELIIEPLTLLFAASYLAYEALTNNASAILLSNLLVSAMIVPLVRFVGKRMVRKMRMMLGGSKAITATVEETLAAQREVRSFNLEDRQSRRLYNLITSYNSKLMQMTAWGLTLTPAVEIASSLALAYSLYRGCGDGLTLEQFAAIATAFYFCYDPVKRLAAIMNQLQLMATAVNAINKVRLAEDETPDPLHPKHLPDPVRGAVDFNHVSFGYNAEKLVLRDVDVHVPPGQIVALVGPSGSGKTTFINLICRFYDVNEGSVSIDGCDVREISRDERMGTIGLVSQFSALFQDTIMENIRVGRPNASDEEVREAGMRARVSEFAEQLDGGYNYELGESGSGLSGGQRQRVSIARAFLKNAPILILDEATSALDMKSEAFIQSALEELAIGHTTFIIAHRFSTIRMAQRILVFEEGRIVADGTHAELYENCLLYRGLYDEQVNAARKENEGQEKEVPV